MKTINLRFGALLYFFAAPLAVFGAGAFAASHTTATAVAPSTMPRIGKVDERYLSYNIEMLEVTGGQFWKPYKSQTTSANSSGNASSSSVPAGMSPDLYQYRPPVDLANARRRKLAVALGPAYVRISGTWANSTYFQDSDDSPQKPPAGFNGVLTRSQWKGVIDFANAVNAKIISSFATSVGTRDANGIWTPTEAAKVLSYTKSAGGSIAAAEFMNEPTFALIGGAPKGYDAAAYGRDISVFMPFIRKAAPEMIILGPGSIGEGGALAMSSMPGFLKSEDLLRATGPVFDAFSFHFYGAVSQRCSRMGGASAGTTLESALSDEWFSRTDTVEAFYAKLRDQFDPGKPLWLTETADAACGGNPWASTFADSFRYLNQLGSLAQRGVQVVAHNTLDASDYGLLDENTLEPRPDYWASLLWHSLMGPIVLKPEVPASPGLHLYAHCLKDKSAGVALLVINANRDTAQSLKIPAATERYTLSASQLTSTQVELNGHTLNLGSDDSLPALKATPTRAGELTFAPSTITFLGIPKADNSSCRVD